MKVMQPDKSSTFFIVVEEDNEQELDIDTAEAFETVEAALTSARECAESSANPHWVYQCRPLRRCMPTKED